MQLLQGHKHPRRRTHSHPQAILKFNLPSSLDYIAYSGLVKGGSGGSADPPKILEPVEKKLEIDILS